jgi:hypothetical protein
MGAIIAWLLIGLVAGLIIGWKIGYRQSFRDLGRAELRNRIESARNAKRWGNG